MRTPLRLPPSKRGASLRPPISPLSLTCLASPLLRTLALSRVTGRIGHTNSGQRLLSDGTTPHISTAIAVPEFLYTAERPSRRYSVSTRRSFRPLRSLEVSHFQT